MTPEHIRSQFIDYFKQREHTIVPSASVVPTDDPTLLFTNAGMNQFKDVFLGTGSRGYDRAVGSQKCIRAGGKHNDLEEVGRDTYHHTFFEMLGNWSFGDYFKAEAIGWAWDLLTNVWGLPKDRLYATVFRGDSTEGLEGDDQTEQLWLGLTDIDPAHLSRWGKQDNFWEMGDTGPCGPCSEIHIDVTPDCSGGAMVNTGSPLVIELWNLVFIQHNRNPDGSLSPLAKQHVDTGLGFERISVVLKHLDALRNHKPCSFSNYGTALFVPLIQQLETLSGYRYGAKATGVETDARYDAGRTQEIADVACRVIADHARMLGFAITDGALPSNEGRGYVVRRVLRRAARFGRQHLDLHQPFIHKLIPALVERMGEAYPELAANADRVTGLILDEEESFGRTLDRGIQLFTQAAEKATADRSKSIGPADAFRLYDTFGFPVDLTVQMAQERDLAVDTEGFEQLMTEARQKARAAAKGHVTVAFDGDLPRTADSMKYLGEQGRGRVLGWVLDNALVTAGQLSPGSEVGLVLDQTCFYSEQGGQVGDAGVVRTATGTFEVATTQVLGDGIVHMGHVTAGVVQPGQPGELLVDAARSRTKSNHTATHLMHKALRQCLGDHAVQRGSLLEPERLRFDFDHSEAVSAEQLAQVERMVNAMIWADHPVRWYEKSRVEAMHLDGLVAMFGEKYGDVVRVVEIGDVVSRELCGGTHVERTGQIGLFKIVGEESVARGVRRISAVTGPGALEYVQDLDAMTRRAAAALNASVEDVPARIEALQRDLREARKTARSGQAADMQSLRQQLLDQADQADGPVVIVSEVPAVPVDQIREAVDWLRTKAGSAAVVLGSKQGEGKVILVAGMTGDMVKAGLHAGNLIREIAPLVGGGGGGKPDLAQAGGKNADGLTDALAKAKALLGAQLGKGG